MPSSSTRGHSCSRRPRFEEAFAASPISVSAIEGIPRLLSADPAEREAAKQTIRERIDLAGALGAVGVLVVPQFGRVPALPDLAPLATGAELERNLLLAQLRELAPAAKAAGVSLFLEPLNRYEAYIVNRLEQGAAIAAEVGPEIGVMADFFHMGIEEVDIAASIRANRQHLVYVHVADSNRLAARARPPRLPPRLPRPEGDRLRRPDRHRVPRRRPLRRGDPGGGHVDPAGVGSGVERPGELRAHPALSLRTESPA